MESRGILTVCRDIRVYLLSFNLMISVSAKMVYQEVIKNFLRSGRNQGKVRENESRKKWLLCKIQVLLQSFRNLLLLEKDL